MKKTYFILVLLIMTAVLSAVPRNLVVVELFTSTMCTGCPGASMGVHDLLLNGLPVAVMTDHFNDPFATATTLARYHYYEIPGTPMAMFDGIDQSMEASFDISLYPSYLPKVNSRITAPSNFSITAVGQADSLNYSVAVSITKEEADTNTDLVLHGAITESAIPYAWLGLTTVENVNRRMIPDQDGTPVSISEIPVGGQLVVPLDFAVKNDWNLSNCEIVLWLQNTVTKEILQAAKYPLSDFTGTVLVNNPPVLTLPPSFDFDVNSSLRLDLSQYIRDAEDDPLVLSCSGNENISVEIEGLNVSLTAPENWSGAEDLVFSVSDGTSTVSAAVRVYVLSYYVEHLSITKSANQIYLNWDEVYNASGYDILASTYPYGTYTQIARVDSPGWSGICSSCTRKIFFKVKAIPN